jgi:hypothetical protein
MVWNDTSARMVSDATICYNARTIQEATMSMNGISATIIYVAWW